MEELLKVEKIINGIRPGLRPKFGYFAFQKQRLSCVGKTSELFSMFAGTQYIRKQLCPRNVDGFNI